MKLVNDMQCEGILCNVEGAGGNMWKKRGVGTSGCIKLRN